LTEYTCQRLLDYGVVTATISELWDAIAEDGAPPYQPDIVNEYYVGIFADGEYIGMYRLHQLKSVLWEGHAFILNRKHSIGSGDAIKKWVVDNLEDARKVIVHIPECFPNVIAFVKKIGFTEQGYNSDSYTKDGIIGVYEFGMKVEDM
jgi:hypothetical protein